MNLFHTIQRHNAGHAALGLVVFGLITTLALIPAQVSAQQLGSEKDHPYAAAPSVPMAVDAPSNMLLAEPQRGAQFQLGDVFAGVGLGNVNWFRGDGTFVQTLTSGFTGETTGMAFDEDNNLYSTLFTAGNLVRYDMEGNLLGTFGGPYTGGSESVVFDADGNYYVGAANGDRLLRKFAPDGTLLTTYSLATGPRGTDWIDLAGDGCTMYYTSEGADVRLYDVCTDTQLPNFATGVLNGGAAYALRLLPDGGVLVANTSDIKRLDSSGTVVQTYDDPAINGVWFALNLDPDGTSFWSGYISGQRTFYKFDIVSGDILLGPIDSMSGQTLAGLAVFGEITQALAADLSIDKSADPTTVAVGDPVTFTLDVMNAGPNEATNVVVTDVLPAEFSFDSSADCTESGGTVTCNLGDIAVGGSASASFVAIAVSPGNVVNEASVASDDPDPVTSNNTDTADVLIQGGGGDTTPPECAALDIEFNGDGMLSAVNTSVSDTGSGIASIFVTSAVNVEAFFDTNGPFVEGETYMTPNPNPNTVQIRAERISFDVGGRFVVTVTDGEGNQAQCDPVVSQLSATVPDGFTLDTAYPNPFHPSAGSARIPFHLAEAGAVRVSVYDVLGREVTVLVDEDLAPGSYEVTWDGTAASGQSLSAGVYFYRLVSGSFSETQQVLIVR